jgi:DNA topoisomerase-1
MKMQAVEKELIDPGWRKAWQPEETVPVGKGTLAALEIGQRVRPKKVRARRQSGLSEAGLIRALREKGIGRPATYALIVESLLSRKYVEREQDGQLRVTQRGREVCEFLVERFPGLFDLAYTARMESALDEIAKGQLSYENAAQDLWASLKGIDYRVPHKR